MRLVFVALLLGGCSFPTPSAEFACQTTPQCDNGRVCEGGFCIRSEDRQTDAAGLDLDAAVGDAPPDADPFEAIKTACMGKGYTLDAATGGYYRSVGTNKTWLDAQADCKADVPNATHLIVLSSAAENTFMRSQLGWVGLSDRATEGTMANVTGEPVDQTFFASGQPDNGNGSEDCVQMKTGGLDDDQCGNGHRYVCECDGKASTP